MFGARIGAAMIMGSACMLVGSAIAADAPAAQYRPTCQPGHTFDATVGACRPPKNIAEISAQKDKPYLVIPRKMPNSGTPFEMHMVETRDQIYVPVAIRKPAGNGPFPAILMAAGNGVNGFSTIENRIYRIEPMVDMMLKRGYVVAYANYRNEIPELYNQIDRTKNVEDTISGQGRTLKSTPTLDSDDYISLIEHMKSLPFVRSQDVGTIGISHAGELQAKSAAVTTWGAGVLIEGASYEYIAVDTTKAPRKDGVMMLDNPDFVKKIANKQKAMERIRNMKTPFLHLGRDKDHLQGVFRTLHDWMVEAGHKDSTWVSAAHDVHGYGYLYRNQDGSFTPDKMQLQFFEQWMKFFDEKLHNSKP